MSFRGTLVFHLGKKNHLASVLGVSTVVSDREKLLLGALRFVNFTSSRRVRQE